MYGTVVGNEMTGVQGVVAITCLTEVKLVLLALPADYHIINLHLFFYIFCGTSACFSY